MDGKDKLIKKIGLTSILALFFILGFIFKYIFDFKFFSEPKIAKNSSQNSSAIKQAAINEAISQSLTNINEVIRAQENKNQIVKDDIYVSPSRNPNFLPIRDWAVPFTEIAAKSAILTDESVSKIFYQKNIYEKLPIASLTKLMTAITIFENTDLNDVAIISKSAVNQEGDAGNFIVNEKTSIENLLKALLIESSNDAAFALEEYMASKNIDLINTMNIKSKALEMKDTHFSSSSGLIDEDNYSTVYDLSKLVSYSLKNRKLWDILNMQSADILSADKTYNHRLTNSNQLLKKLPEILGGKTGYTEKSGGCLLVSVKINEETKIIGIILGSNDRFGEMEKLINWVKSAYRF